VPYVGAAGDGLRTRERESCFGSKHKAQWMLQENEIFCLTCSHDVSTSDWSCGLPKLGAWKVCLVRARSWSSGTFVSGPQVEDAS
jgi:hypothetical protein